MKNLSGIEHELDVVTKKYVDDAAGAKVDKVEGKQLSTNDYTTEEKNKLNSLENYTLPAASADALGGVKIGNNLAIDENGVLDINKYTIPEVGETQEIQTLYGKYLLTTNVNSPYIQWKGSPVSELSRTDGITSSAKIKWTVDFNNTSFIIAVDGKSYKIEFGENDFDFSNKNAYLDWQIKIQEKIDQAIGEKIARVMIISSGSHPVTGGYTIRILYAEELTDNYPFLQVFSAEENDTLALINIASGSAIQLNLNKTIAEYMNTSVENFSYEVNGISFSLNTNITLQEFFDAFNANNSQNIIIEYAKKQDAILITSYTNTLMVADTIGLFSALGFTESKEELTGNKCIISITQPDGTFLENIELKESEFTFDNNLALLQLLQQNNKGTLEYDALENKPTLNGIEISGNMTSEDLGINNSNISYGSEEPEDENTVVWIDPSGNAVSLLTTDNTVEYTPTGDYNPATKKYVDDNIIDHTHSATDIIAGLLASGMSCNTPTENTHLANKAYVDSKAGGVQFKSGSFSVSTTNTNVSVSTGFYPDLVIIYTKFNNRIPLLTSNSGKAYQVPIILTKALTSEYSKITTTGFIYNNQGSNDSGTDPLYYFAIKF